MRRLLDTVLLAACLPALAPVLAVIVLREIGVALVELRQGDKRGAW